MATVREIAAQAGVSPGTVSKVLNGRGSISRELRGKVISAARQLGHNFDHRCVAVVVASSPNFHGYSGELLTAIMHELSRREVSVEIIPLSSLQLLSEHQISGAIAMVLDNGIEHFWARNQILPLVCIQTNPSHLNGIYTVGSNNDQGITAAFDLLRQHHHEKIAYVEFDVKSQDQGRNNNDMRDRLKIYRRCCQQSTPELPACKIINDESLIAALQAGYTAFMVIGEGSDLWFCNRLHQLGVRIPQDVSVIGFESQLSQMVYPPMTTIAQRFPEIARQAVNTLLKLIDHTDTPQDIYLDYRLIQRESVADVSKCFRFKGR